jgi:phosphoribosylformimino-5-aminoimidazole carboxamide ribotide isomerase
VQIYPAIDIRGGRVARADAPDPVATAEGFLAAGARWLHVVDLDRAFDTGRDNDAVVRRIAGLRGASVQAGGLLTTRSQVERALELGAKRAVVATAAAADPRVLATIVGPVAAVRLALAIDVRDGRVVHRDAPRALPIGAAELAGRAASAGIGVVVYRDLARDGALGGPDLEGARRVLGLGPEVLLAGGVAGMEDLVTARDAGLAGAIVGRAFYEGRLTVREALQCCS